MPRKLTRKQKAFADQLIANPTMSGKAAALKAYGNIAPGTAEQVAHYNMKSPLVQAYMQKHSELAQEAMLELLANSRQFAKGGDRDGAAYAGVAFNIAKDIMDRVHGKATQKIEQQSTSVTISIDLSGVEEPSTV